MRLPHSLLHSPFFQFESNDEFLAALRSINRIESELEEATRLASICLPPVTSETALAAMLGVNPGIIWSIRERKKRYYREFQIRKSGGGSRTLLAPKVALKIIQKWIGHHIQQKARLDDHVHGFVTGRSHITAAETHLRANWVYSVDIENFFSTTGVSLVKSCLVELGYGEASANLLADLFTLDGVLPQGSPASPPISNLVFRGCDQALLQLSNEFSTSLTRYADDIVFSGADEFNPELAKKVQELFDQTTWRLSEKKTEFARRPARLKVHGLLVDGERLRLTKGYRNKIRAFKHLVKNNKISKLDMPRVNGHIGYADQIDGRT